MLISAIIIMVSVRSFAVTDTIRTGSFLINMGVTPQTIANGLKPYGLVYVLLKNFQVPIKWAINPSKAKDGIDFIHNGITYRGGVFVIPFNLRTPAVDSVIASWQALGVVGATTISDIITDVARTFYFAPRWTMDKDNGNIAVNYFTNAGIPSSAYGGSSSTGWKNPSELGACDDIFVMPHADPTWATHNNLYYWNLNHKGNLWAACHAVSVLEQLTSPDLSIKMNFLTTTGLLNYGSHSNTPSPPYTYNDVANPIMQFMLTMDNALNSGSERLYMPGLTSGWRGSTTLGLSDNTNVDIPVRTLGPVSPLAYGRGFGDNNRGMVMYEGGHNHNMGGAIAERVAAQRAFFNYSFFVAHDRFADIPLAINNLPTVLTENVPVNISLSVPAFVDLSQYTIQWTSSVGGTFSPNANSQNVTYTPPFTNDLTNISVSITDACSRSVFSTESSITTWLLSTNTFLQAITTGANEVSLTWKENHNPVYAYVVEKSNDGKNFTPVQQVLANSSVPSYELKDALTQENENYYRLKIIYRGSLIKYSNVIRMQSGLQNESPLVQVTNPVYNQIQLTVNAIKSEQYILELYDLAGKKLVSKPMSLKKGISTFSFDPSIQMKKGNYLLRVSAGSFQSMHKLSFQ
jgi:hypothetical protein